MKKIALLLVLTMLAGLAAGCSNTAPAPNQGDSSTVTALAKIPELSISCNQPGQSWMLIGTTLAEYLKGTMDLVVVPGSTYGNILVTNSNETQFGITASTSLGSAKNGLRYYEQHGKQENVRFVASIYKHSLRGFTNNPDIKTWNDLIGRSITYGPPGSEGFDYNPMIFSYLGFSESDLELKIMPIADAADQKKNKQLDCFIGCMPTPYALMDDVAYSDSNAHLISLDKEYAERLKADWEGFNYDDYSTIEGNIWKFEEPLYSPYQLITIIAHKDVPDEQVYSMTKTLYDNFDALADVVPSFKGIVGGRDAMIYNDANLIVHPGAEKFWTEVGLTVK